MDSELNINDMSDRMVAEMNGENYEPPKDDAAPPADDLDAAVDSAVDESPADAPTETQDVDLKTDAPADDDYMPAPQSWKKEMRPVWDKMAKGQTLTPDEAKSAAKYYNEREQQMLTGLNGYKSDAEYGRSLKQVIGQYEDILQAQGIDAAKAVNYLFAAHKQLSSGSPEQRMAYLQQVAQSYGLDLNAKPHELPPEQQQLQQALSPIEQRLQKFEQAMQVKERQEFEARQKQAATEVEKFASDPAHPYFDEVADDIIAMIKMGLPLADAYEKAVWANPVTRQKEIDRTMKEKADADRKKAQEAAQKAKKAASTNVRSRDTGRALAEPTATMDNLDDVLRETMADIRTRT